MCNGSRLKQKTKNKTKQNETKQNKTKQNKTKQKQNKKHNKTKQNKTKRNKTKQNKIKTKTKHIKQKTTVFVELGVCNSLYSYSKDIFFIIKVISRGARVTSDLYVCIIYFLHGIYDRGPCR